VPPTFGLPPIIGSTLSESLRWSRMAGPAIISLLATVLIVVPKAVLKRLEFEQACVARPLDRNSRSQMLRAVEGARGARMHQSRSTVFHASSD
jgi:hypothetical protein